MLRMATVQVVADRITAAWSQVPTEMLEQASVDIISWIVERAPVARKTKKMSELIGVVAKGKPTADFLARRYLVKTKLQSTGYLEVVADSARKDLMAAIDPGVVKTS